MGQLFKLHSSNPPPPDLGEPPDVIREWADKVIESWGLSRREREVLDIMLKGCGDVEIAEVLGIGPPAVKKSLRSVYDKAGVDSRSELFAEILRL